MLPSIKVTPSPVARIRRICKVDMMIIVQDAMLSRHAIDDQTATRSPFRYGLSAV
jgi:hypothetical protein